MAVGHKAAKLNTLLAPDGASELNKGCSITGTSPSRFRRGRVRPVNWFEFVIIDSCTGLISLLLKSNRLRLTRFAQTFTNFEARQITTSSYGKPQAKRMIDHTLANRFIYQPVPTTQKTVVALRKAAAGF